MNKENVNTYCLITSLVLTAFVDKRALVISMTITIKWERLETIVPLATEVTVEQFHIGTISKTHVYKSLII